MLTIEKALEKLSAYKGELVLRYPISRLGVFGSIVRGEATPDSDVDILVEFSAPVGLEFVDLAEELEEILGHRVDLVSRDAIKPRVWPYIKEDVRYV